MWERMELPSARAWKVGFEGRELCSSMLSSPPPDSPPDVSLEIVQRLGKALWFSGKQSSKMFI